MTPEGRIKLKVRDILARFPGLYQYWPVPTGRGAPTLDCIVAYYGQMVAIETKAPGNKLTPRQLLCKRDMEAAGVKVFVIDGTLNTDTPEKLEAHLCSILEGATRGNETVPDCPAPARNGHPARP